MVEVHKEILGRLGTDPKACILDTPAGFQLNAEQLSQRAVEYFRANIGRNLVVASFRSRSLPPLDAERAFSTLREADYVLVGPGSPTYAVQQWSGTPVPDLLVGMIERGGCLVAASAAALTVGRCTLPVYEIYKVGQALHWAEGLDILGRFGLSFIVIPHWNNAEGGTHDTRFCFMGETRFRALESMLPTGVRVLGLDEHTACIIDMGGQEVSVRGVGSVTLRSGRLERTFQRGERFPLEVLTGEESSFEGSRPSAEEVPARAPAPEEAGFWDAVHALGTAFEQGLRSDPRDATNALLGLDRLIWKAQQEMENPEFISQAREIFQEQLVLLGAHLSTLPGARRDCLSPLVKELLALRDSFRKNRQWHEADAIRDCLRRVHVEIEDTPEGYRWRLDS
jgi:peptidase E